MVRVKRQGKNKVNTAERLRVKLAEKKGEKKICLTCIMKNESKNVNRLLDSLYDKSEEKYLIDMISIVDTGSTDNTEALLLKWGKKHNIPTVVHHEPFINFAYNRTHSVLAAKQAFPDADFFLLSDADFVWEINTNGKFNKKLLIDHQYYVEQYNKKIRYQNVRLLSAEIDWVCEGLTHEYWAACKNQTRFLGTIRTGKITTLIIDDREDGGCKEDKFIRDEKLLRQGLEDPTTTPLLQTRYKFYLAQTLKDLGRNLESIEWYKKRILDKGFDEEVYYSKYQIGCNYSRLAWGTKYQIDKILSETSSEPSSETSSDTCSLEQLKEQETLYFNKAIKHYFSAYMYRKTRAEALYHLTELCRSLGRNQEAYEYAILGKKIKFPADTLFVEKDCYTYLFDFEISICAFYVPGKKEEGREAICRLLDRDDVPPHLLDVIKNNSRSYL